MTRCKLNKEGGNFTLILLKLYAENIIAHWAGATKKKYNNCMLALPIDQSRSCAVNVHNRGCGMGTEMCVCLPNIQDNLI